MNGEHVSNEAKTATSLPDYGMWAREAEYQPRDGLYHHDTMAGCQRVQNSQYTVKEDETTASSDR